MPIYKDENPTKDGRQYYFTVSYQDNGKYKKYKSKKYLTKKECQKAEAVYLASNGSFTNRDITIGDLVKLFLQERKTTLKPTSYRITEKNCEYITELLGNVVASRMNERQYELFRNEINNRNWTVSYKNKMIKQLKSVFLFGSKMYGIENSVMDKYEWFKDNAPVEKLQYYTIEQMQLFLTKAKEEDFRLFAFFQTLALMGLRLGENNALTWNDIDFDNHRLDINKSIATKYRDDDGNYLVQSPKTKQSVRVLPMPDQVYTTLTQLYDTFSKEKGFSHEWRVYGGKKAIAESTLTKFKNKVMDECGLPRISIHSFRHSFVSMCVSFGNVPISVISKMVGHSSIEQTAKVYSHLFISQLDDLAKMISGI